MRAQSDIDQLAYGFMNLVRDGASLHKVENYLTERGIGYFDVVRVMVNIAKDSIVIQRKADHGCSNFNCSVCDKE